MAATDTQTETQGETQAAQPNAAAPRIAKLPPLLVNQIAAGEVIDRPNSVVKELLDNALDAGASRIRIDIEHGGAQLVRVADDGHGISPEQLPLALAAHATSKLQRTEDLEAIATLGFRGEALASIASVSRLRLSSLPTLDGVRADAAAMLEQAGDEVSELQPAAHAPGTVVEVRDLFFNTPARRKFLRAASTEFGHIADTVDRLAMTHPSVGFTLTHTAESGNTRTTLDVPPNQTRRERCVAVLGKELDEGLLEASHEDPPQQGGARLWALLGRPEIARATTKFQYFTVNGRPVKDRQLAHAVKEAFRGLIPPDKHPVAVLQLWLDPKAVDVNVHPTKAEVRFREPSKVHGLVLAACRRCLLGHDLTPQVHWKTPEVSSPIEPAAAPLLAPPLPAPPGETESTPAPQTSTDPAAFVDYFKRMDPKQKGFVYDEVKREMADAPPPTINETEAAPPSLKPQPILQVHDSFVVTQDEQGVLIIDQHALHERMMFESLRARILDQGKPLESQRLLVPATLPGDDKRQSLLASLQPLLIALGIEAEPIGPRTIAVHAFPTLLFDRKVEPDAFVSEVLDKAAQGTFAVDAMLKPSDGDDSAPAVLDRGLLEAALHEVLDTMSCKAAVKAGDRLTDAELAELLARREALERASNCPHGRPTTLRLSLADLYRQFGRT
ncbi:MAG: DNA mismatch repair endonuclease MutL [Planctomycetota bacterium]